MRNRANTPPRDENDFIRGGSAGIDRQAVQPETPPLPQKTTKAKAKPVSISFAEENLQAIDNIIKDEVMAGHTRTNRSDVVRAAVMALGKLPQEQINLLIKKAKLQ